MSAPEPAQAIVDRLEAPIVELRFLLDRGYRRTHALRAVSEHHQLAREDRNVLERVVFPQSESRARRRRLVRPSDLAGQALVIDGFNQLIGLECLLSGEPLFLADDGLVRDMAAVRGRYDRSGATDRAMQLLCGFLARRGVGSVGFVFDHQVSRSGELAAACREALAGLGVPGQAATSRHTDRAIRRAAAAAVISSSDRAIIDATPRVFDAVHALADERDAPLGRPPRS